MLRNTQRERARKVSSVAKERERKTERGGGGSRLAAGAQCLQEHMQNQMIEPVFVINFC